jgi:hypothetical protein
MNIQGKMSQVSNQVRHQTCNQIGNQVWKK